MAESTGLECASSDSLEECTDSESAGLDLLEDAVG